MQSGSKAVVADVYADDLGNDAGLAPGAYRFVVFAEAEPDVFGRIANIFTITNVAPFSAQLTREPASMLRFTIDFDAIGVQMVDLLRRKLVQLVSVTAVEVSVRFTGLADRS